MMEQPIAQSLSEPPCHELQPFLNAREALIWVGQPKQGLLFRKSDGLLIPFTLGWVGIAFAILVGIGSTQGIASLMPIVGVFLMLGFWLLMGRFLLDIYQRAHTIYGITNQRILIATSGVLATVQSFEIKSLETVKVEAGANGRGTITIEESSYTPPIGVNVPIREGDLPRLEEIPNVKDVYTLIQAIRD